VKGRRLGQTVGTYYGDRGKEKGSGAWCYNARLAKNLTIAELADLARVSTRTIKRIEAGTERRAGSRRSYWLRKALGLKVP
jgi:transcriptional regulator with XRE-family HTH domain